MKNYWNEFEYSKYKLLLHPKKFSSIMKILVGEKQYDELFPVSVELHLTNRCNLHCKWCTDHALHSQEREMNTDTICRLLAELASYGTGITIEGGGEPTIHPDFRRIVGFGKSCGASMGLITNGTVDISDVIHCFRWIRVSLDASTEEEYIQEKCVNRFNDVLNNLYRFSMIRDESQTQLGVGFVITKHNYSMLSSLVRQLDKIGIDYIYIRPVEEFNSLRPDQATLYSIMQTLEKVTESLRIKCIMRVEERFIDQNAGLPCIAHSLTSIIHANGDVVMCEKRRHDIKVFGNMESQTFASIWTSETRRVASQCTMHGQMQQGCSVCRMTEYNQLLYNLAKVQSVEFI